MGFQVCCTNPSILLISQLNGPNGSPNKQEDFAHKKKFCYTADLQLAKFKKGKMLGWNT